MRNRLFNTIIKYCDTYYGECENSSCINCNNEHGCNKSCENCLDNLTNINTGGRSDYNCKKLASYYVCKFLNRFASEMYYLLDGDDMWSTFKDLDKIKILSLGCGPASDIIALNELNNNMVNNPYKIDYCGVDIAKSWEHINNKIIEYYNKGNDGSKVKFIYEDVFKYVKENQLKDINLLIIQNLISTFKKSKSTKKLKNFIEDITNNIVSFMPQHSFIIISDINSCNLLRDDWLSLITKNLKECERQGHYFIYYFDKAYSDEWIQHSNNRALFDYPSSYNEYYYNVWDKCKSVQLKVSVEK